METQTNQKTTNGPYFDSQSQIKQKILAIILAAISGVFFTLQNLFVKLIPSLGVAQIVFIRYFVQLFLTLPAMIADRVGTTEIGDCRALLFVFGLTTCLTGAMSALAITLIPFGDAMTIIFSSPVIVMIASHCIFKEKCEVYRIFIVIIFMTGIIFVTKPTKMFSFKDDGEITSKIDSQIMGYFAALLATTVLALRMILTKKLNHLHYSVLIFASSSVTMISTAMVIVPTTGFKLPDTWAEVYYSLLVGISGYLGFILMYGAMKFETASVVSMVKSLEIVLSYYVQIKWFGDVEDTISLTGAGLVVFGIVVMTQEDQIKELFKKCYKDDDDMA